MDTTGNSSDSRTASAVAPSSIAGACDPRRDSQRHGSEFGG